MLFNIIIATALVGLIGVLGAYGVIKFLAKNHARVMLLVSFAAGSMIAVSFFELLPEAITQHGQLMRMMEFLVLGFVIFLLIEKAMIYYHCHEEDCHLHGPIKLIILSDIFHNFLDGVAVAASFLAGNLVGIFTTLAIVIHEIPKEIGGIGVLIHGGFSNLKALLYNLFTAVAAVIGGILAFYFLEHFVISLPYVLAITAGGFIYIAAADLLPEGHHDSTTKLKTFLHSLIIVLGILTIWVLSKYIGE